MKNILLISLLFVGWASGAIAQKWTIELDSVLQDIEKEGFFDGQILIAENGKVLFNNAYGSRGADTLHTPISKDTPLPVFSVGKSFTALSIMRLESQGLIYYDDNLRKFIPELPYEKVTIRHLLTMTSGLPRFLETALKHADTTTVISNPGILKLIAQHQPEAGMPGEKFEYNNSNYILLALIIERVSGLSFTAFLDQYIFQPLGMNHTYETVPSTLERLSQSATNADNFYQPYGTGTVATTATDLFQYDQALYSDQLLDGEQISAAFECVELTDRSSSNYGFGWRIVDCGTLKEVYHVGDGPGIRSSFQRMLSDNKTLIYLHTGSNIYHEEVYRLVRNIWEGQSYQFPVRRIQYNIDTELYQQYTGSYLSNFGLIHISTADGKLYLRPDAIPGKEELVPSSDTTFYFRDQNLHWEFFLDEQNEVIGFGIKGDRENMGVKQ